MLARAVPCNIGVHVLVAEVDRAAGSGNDEAAWVWWRQTRLTYAGNLQVQVTPASGAWIRSPLFSPLPYQPRLVHALLEDGAGRTRVAAVRD